MYQWSKGTSICVAVTGHKDQKCVILNPERHARIGDCKSIFVMCNNLDVTLAMLRTESLLSVIRRLRSVRSNQNLGGRGTGRQGSTFFSAESVHHLNLPDDNDDDEDDEVGDIVADDVELGKKSPEVRQVTRSRAYTETVAEATEATDDDEPIPLVFKRDSRSYRKSIAQAAIEDQPVEAHTDEPFPANLLTVRY